VPAKHYALAAGALQLRGKEVSCLVEWGSYGVGVASCALELSARMAGRGGKPGQRSGAGGCSWQNVPSEHDALTRNIQESDRPLHYNPSTPPILIYASVTWLPPEMRSVSFTLSCLAALSSFAAAELNLSQPLLSRQVLASTFKPPQVFKNANLVRTTNLDKSYARETVNVIVENVDSKPQTEYYLPFDSSLISRVGGFEVKDKKSPEKGNFKVEVAEFDTER
jgi:hypothetical protein